MNLGEHLISVADCCCVTIITPNGCHYGKWPDYCESVWKTYRRLNKPASNETPLRSTLSLVYKRLSHTALAARAIITFFYYCYEWTSGFCAWRTDLSLLNSYSFKNVLDVVFSALASQSWNVPKQRNRSFGVTTISQDMSQIQNVNNAEWHEWTHRNIRCHKQGLNNRACKKLIFLSQR